MTNELLILNYIFTHKLLKSRKIVDNFNPNFKY